MWRDGLPGRHCGLRCSPHRRLAVYALPAVRICGPRARPPDPNCYPFSPPFVFLFFAARSAGQGVWLGSLLSKAIAGRQTVGYIIWQIVYSGRSSSASRDGVGLPAPMDCLSAPWNCVGFVRPTQARKAQPCSARRSAARRVAEAREECGAPLCLAPALAPAPHRPARPGWVGSDQAQPGSNRKPPSPAAQRPGRERQFRHFPPCQSHGGGSDEKFKAPPSFFSGRSVFASRSNYLVPTLVLEGGLRGTARPRPAHTTAGPRAGRGHVEGLTIPSRRSPCWLSLRSSRFT